MGIRGMDYRAGQTMAISYASQAPHVPVVELIEPTPAPLIPVSGISSVTVVAGGQVCIAYYQAVPALAGDCEHHVCARLLWAPTLIMPASRFLWGRLRGIPAVAEQLAHGTH